MVPQWIDAKKSFGEMTAKGGVNGYGHTLGCYHLRADDVFLPCDIQQQISW